MNNAEHQLFLHLLQSEFKLATGCTDPAAIASAVARASEQLKSRQLEDVAHIEVELSPNILKNGYHVDIPGTSERGIEMAAALGYVMGDSITGFEVFRGLQDEHVILAKQLVTNNKVVVRQSNEGLGLSIHILLTTVHGERVDVLMKQDYFLTHHIKVNDQIVYSNEAIHVDHITDLGYTLQNFVHFIDQVAIDELQFVAEGIQTNVSFLEEGLINARGLQIGKVLMNAHQADLAHGTISDISMRIKMLTAAAVDSRMGGSPLPVMSSGGSGNLGLGGTIPIVVVCEHHGYTDEQRIRAVALANLVHIYMKQMTGRLTAVCGGILVGMGTSAAIVWLQGGSLHQMEGAINNLTANLTGMICDGANYGCSFKVSTAAVEAYFAATLALQGCIATSTEGIVGEHNEQTLRNVARIYLEMNKLDPVILQMIPNTQTSSNYDYKP